MRVINWCSRMRAKLVWMFFYLGKVTNRYVQNEYKMFETRSRNMNVKCWNTNLHICIGLNYMKNELSAENSFLNINGWCVANEINSGWKNVVELVGLSRMLFIKITTKEHTLIQIFFCSWYCQTKSKKAIDLTLITMNSKTSEFNLMVIFDPNRWRAYIWVHCHCKKKKNVFSANQPVNF